MNKEEIDRKIAVIWIADVVGYSKHMEKNEKGTLLSYEECNVILKNLLKKYNGKVFNTGGDSVLAEFPSAVKAVECGIEFQKKIKKRNSLEQTDIKIEFRIGINTGDVILRDGNLLGEGVNIAARLEALSQAGGISISKGVYDYVVSKINVTFNDQGIQKVKDNEFHVFDIIIDPSQKRSLKTKKTNTIIYGIISSISLVALIGFLYIFNNSQLLNKNNIPLSFDTVSVVPFDIKTDSKEINNLATGIFQDIISGINKSEIQLKAKPISNNSLNIKQDSIDKGAHFLLKGTLLGDQNIVRANMSLVETNSENIIWSKTINGNIREGGIFEVQDLMVNEIVDMLSGNGFVLENEIYEKIQNKSAENLNQSECIIIARRYMRFFLEKNLRNAVKCLNNNILKFPKNSELYAQLANIQIQGVQLNLFEDSKSILSKAAKNADQAIMLNPQRALGHFTRGRLKYISKEWDSMYNSVEKALKLAPSNLEILSGAGFMLYWGGKCNLEDYKDRTLKYSNYLEGDCRWKTGLDAALRGHKLDLNNYYPSKHYPIVTAFQYWAWAEKEKKFYEQAFNQIQLSKQPGFFWYHMHSANSAAGWGKDELAREHYNEIKKIIKSEKINDVLSHHVNWNVEKTYWLITKSFLPKFGFN